MLKWRIDYYTVQYSSVGLFRYFSFTTADKVSDRLVSKLNIILTMWKKRTGTVFCVIGLI